MGIATLLNAVQILVLLLHHPLQQLLSHVDVAQRVNTRKRQFQYYLQLLLPALLYSFLSSSTLVPDEDRHLATGRERIERNHGLGEVRSERGYKAGKVRYVFGVPDTAELEVFIRR
jgi:hypothetical protein